MMKEKLQHLRSWRGDLGAQLISSSFGTIGLNACYMLFQFVVGVALARLLGPTSLGVYTFAISVSQLLAIFAQFGFPSFLVRAIATYRAEKASPKILRLVATAMQTVVFVSVCTVIGAYIAATLTVPAGFPLYTWASSFMLIPLLALLATSGGALRGLGQTVVSQVPELLVRPLLFLAGIAGFSYFNFELSPQRALLTHAGAAFFALGVALFLLAKSVSSIPSTPTAATQRYKWIWQSVPFLLLAAANVLNYQSDVVMLGFLTTSDQVGLYRVAGNMELGMSIPLIAIPLVLAPHIARLYALQDWASLQNMLVASHRVCLGIMLPAAMILYWYGDTIIAFVFGEEFGAASSVLQILVVGKMLYASVAFATITLSMLGKPGTATVFVAITVMLNIALNFFLIPKYGIEGAALATAISFFAGAIASAIFVRLNFGYGVSAFRFL